MGLLALGFLWVTVAVLLTGPLVALDHRVDLWVHHNVPRDVIHLTRRYLVDPGQRLYNVPPLAVLAVVVAWRRREWRPLLVPLAVMVFLALVVPGLKLWTGRTNPLSGADQLFAGGTEYPSGHTINAIVVWGMTFALAAALDWPVGRWLTTRRRHLLTAAITVVVAGGVVIARTHWLTDVIASLFFGVLLLWVVLRCGFIREERMRTVAADALERPAGRPVIDQPVIDQPVAATSRASRQTSSAELTFTAGRSAVPAREGWVGVRRSAPAGSEVQRKRRCLPGSGGTVDQAERSG